MIPTVHGPELIIILIIILLLFGAKRIPELAKGLGTGVREFRRGTREGGEGVEDKSEEKKGEELTAAEKDDSETQAQEDASADKAEQKPS